MIHENYNKLYDDLKEIYCIEYTPLKLSYYL